MCHFQVEGNERTKELRDVEPVRNWWFVVQWGHNYGAFTNSIFLFIFKNNVFFKESYRLLELFAFKALYCSCFKL
jgi:hypothetical protein